MHINMFCLPQVRRSATPSAKPEPAAQPPAAVANNGAGSAAAPPPADAAKVAPPAPAPAAAAAPTQQPSSDLAELKRVLATAVAAQEQYSQYSQEQVGARGFSWFDLVQIPPRLCAARGWRQYEQASAAACRRDVKQERCPAHAHGAEGRHARGQRTAHPASRPPQLL